MKTLTWKGRALAFAVGALVCACISYPLVRSSQLHAAEPPLPGKMKAEDVVKLDRAMTHIRELRMQAAAQLEQAAKPYNDEATSVLAIYKINPDDLGKTVGINLATGEIQRRPAEPQTPAAATSSAPQHPPKTPPAGPTIPTAAPRGSPPAAKK